MNGNKKDELVLVGVNDTLVVSVFCTVGIRKGMSPSDKEVAQKIHDFLVNNTCGAVYSELVSIMKGVQ